MLRGPNYGKGGKTVSEGVASWPLSPPRHWMDKICGPMARPLFYAYLVGSFLARQPTG